MAEVTEQDLIDTINGTETETAPVVTTPVENVDNPTPPPVAPVIPTAEQQPPAAPVFNFDEELKTISNGEITSKEQLAEILGKTKGLGELEAKLKIYEEENSSLKAKVDVNPFANDFTKKMNDLYKSGVPQHTIDAFVRINKVENIDDLQPLEARKLALQIKEGLTADEAEDYIKGLYKLEADDPEDDDEAAQVRRANITLKVDANADKEFLKTHKAEVSQTPVDNSAKEAQARQEEHTKQVEALTPVAKNILSTLSFKEININGKEGEAAVKMDFEPTPESKSFVESRIMDMVQNMPQNFPNTPEGHQTLREVAENMLVVQNWKQMLATATNTREKDVRAEYHNPSTPNRGNDNPNVGKTSKEELAQWIAENSQ